MAALERLPLPCWVVVWFCVTAIVCIYDGLFILLRPHSLPGGKYGDIWYLYKYYISVDKRYQDVDDNFVFTVTVMNLFEVFLNFVAVVLHFGRNRLAVPVAYTVSVMTLWKTVHYFLMFFEFCAGSRYRVENTFNDELLFVIIPNVIWVVFPAAVMAVLWNRKIPPPDREEIRRKKPKGKTH